MCIICVEWSRGRLTIDEAFQNLAEMDETITEEHYEEVIEKLNKAIEVETSFANILQEDNFVDEDEPIIVRDEEEWDAFWNDDSENWEDVIDD